MRIPVWLTLAVAVVVVLFGAYRLRMAFRTEDEDTRAKKRGGLYGMGRRTHALVGLVYLLLGGALIATSFGWNPMGGMFGPATETPAKGKEPTSSGVPTDQLPSEKKEK